MPHSKQTSPQRIFVLALQACRDLKQRHGAQHTSGPALKGVGEPPTTPSASDPTWPTTACAPAPAKQSRNVLEPVDNTSVEDAGALCCDLCKLTWKVEFASLFFYRAAPSYGEYNA